MVTMQASRGELAAYGLATIGALNWGSKALLRKDLVAAALGENSKASRAVYAAVGAAGAVTALSLARKARRA